MPNFVSEIPCRLDFIGNGVLRITKPVPGAPGEYDPEGAHFRLVKREAGSMRCTTEHVPGFTGLTLDAARWMAFIDRSNPVTVLELTHPEWTCFDYEAWKAKPPT